MYRGPFGPADGQFYSNGVYIGRQLIVPNDSYDVAIALSYLSWFGCSTNPRDYTVIWSDTVHSGMAADEPLIGN